MEISLELESIYIFCQHIRTILKGLNDHSTNKGGGETGKEREKNKKIKFPPPYPAESSWNKRKLRLGFSGDLFSGVDAGTSLEKWTSFY